MSTFRPWLMCLLAALFYAYEFFLRVTPSVTTQELSLLYHMLPQAVGALSATYFYAYTPLQIAAGTLMDHYGVRRLLTLSSFLCAMGTLIFISGWSLTLAGIGRFAIGVGSAFAFVGVLKIAADWLPNRYFAIISGLTTALGMVGAISGEVLITELKVTLGYPHTMMLSIGFGLLLTLALWFCLVDHQTIPKHQRIKDELSRLTRDVLQVLRIRQLVLNALIGMCLFSPTTLFAGLWAIPYLTEVKQFTPHTAAYMSSAIFVGWIMGGPLMGTLSAWLKRRKPLLYLGSIGALMTSLVILYIPITNQTLLLSFFVAYGFFSSAQVLVFAISFDLTPNHLAGTAVALTNMFVMFGGFFQPLIGWILLHQKQYSVLTQYHTALSILPLLFLAAGVLTLFLKETCATPVYNHPKEAT